MTLIINNEKIRNKDKHVSKVFTLIRNHYQFIDTIKKVKYKYSILVYLPQVFIKFLFYKKHVLLLNNISLDTTKLQNDKFELNYHTIEKAIKKLLL